MASSFYSSYEHIVFSTKRREVWFDAESSKSVFAYLAGAVKLQGCQSISVGGHENHVHLLVRKKKGLLTEDLVRDIKKTSSQWFNEEWNGEGRERRPFHWQAGYGAFSISYWDLEKIDRYIRNQAEHHRKMSWEEEFKKLLAKHGVEYDERYYLD